MAGRRALPAAALLAALAGGCIIQAHRVEVNELHPTSPVRVTTPVKAHLADGSIVVYWTGVDVTDSVLDGAGWRYTPTLQDSVRIRSVTLDSVIGLESFETGVDSGRTLAASIPATIAGGAAAAFGAALLMVAIFGSCPTIYSDSAGVAVLESEAFPYSISRYFEARDVDALRVQPGAGGAVVLEVRNEALETHYVDHMELLEVRHAAGELAVPDPRGLPLAVAGLRAPARAAGGDGRDVADVLAAVDGRAYRLSDDVLARAARDDSRDALELVIPRPAGRDTVALVLRMRNSLLTTVLLYDMMLADAGAAALDWIGADLARAGPAVELWAWYAGNMGMTVEVHDGTAWQRVDRIPDAGPVGWTDVAVRIPVPRAGDSLRVRLGSVADAWRIDAARFALEVRAAAYDVVPAAAVIGPDGREDPAALRWIGASDNERLVTRPGDRYWVRFEPPPADGERTFFLATEGYYVEWVRGAWARGPARGTFQPGRNDILPELLARWAARRDDFERDFENYRVPVR
jgi:hypothetical protein